MAEIRIPEASVVEFHLHPDDRAALDAAGLVGLPNGAVTVSVDVDPETAESIRAWLAGQGPSAPSGRPLATK